MFESWSCGSGSGTCILNLSTYTYVFTHRHKYTCSSHPNFNEFSELCHLLCERFEKCHPAGVQLSVSVSISVKWGHRQPSNHLKSETVYVNSLWKPVRASSSYCHLVITSKFTSGVRFLTSVPLAFFIHCAAYLLRGWASQIQRVQNIFLYFFLWYFLSHNFLFSLSGTPEREMSNCLDLVFYFLDWFSNILLSLFIL